MSEQPGAWTVIDRVVSDVLTHDVPASVVILIVVLTQAPWWARYLYVLIRRR
jgi:hypothetical protein